MSSACFYVYDLIDPRDGSTFYVGKGTRQRMYQHAKEAGRGVSSRKCDRIRDIASAGLHIQERIVARFSNEAEAYEFEAKRISEIGRHWLTNVMRGGFGGAASRAVEWSDDAVRALAWLARLPADQRIELGGYDISFAVPMAPQFAHQFSSDVGFPAARKMLAKHGVALAQANGC